MSLNNQLRIKGSIDDFKVIGGGTSQSGEELSYEARFVLHLRNSYRTCG